MTLKLPCRVVERREFLDGLKVSQSNSPSERITHFVLSSFSLESQLQLAYINQIYFHGQDAEQIFGSVRMELAHEMVQSIEIDNPETFQGYPAFLPSNFV